MSEIYQGCKVSFIPCYLVVKLEAHILPCFIQHAWWTNVSFISNYAATILGSTTESCYGTIWTLSVEMQVLINLHHQISKNNIIGNNLIKIQIKLGV